VGPVPSRSESSSQPTAREGRPRCYSGESQSSSPGAAGAISAAPGPPKILRRPGRARPLAPRSLAWRCRRPTCRRSRPRRATTAIDSRCTGHAFSAPSRRAPRVCANYNGSRRQLTPACVTPRDAIAPTEPWTTMAHSRCVTCRARVWREGNPADHLRDLCPGCGGSLEPVSDLSELIGLRSLRARPRSAGRALPDRSRRIAAAIRRSQDSGPSTPRRTR
jgi:hypothetical protein